MMLDTHVAVRLYEGRVTGISAHARRLLNHQPVSISPAVVLELEVLLETGRIRVGGAEVARYLSAELDIAIAGEPFAQVVTEALAHAFSRDPFDRLIVAHAALLDAHLLTFDEDFTCTTLELCGSARKRRAGRSSSSGVHCLGIPERLCSEQRSSMANSIWRSSRMSSTTSLIRSCNLLTSFAIPWGSPLINGESQAWVLRPCAEPAPDSIRG